MTPWGEKPGGGFNDSAWLGNAKRQSLFRQSAGPISWAGKPNTPGMMQQPTLQQPTMQQPSPQPRTQIPQQMTEMAPQQMTPVRQQPMAPQSSGIFTQPGVAESTLTGDDLRRWNSVAEDWLRVPEPTAKPFQGFGQAMTYGGMRPSLFG